MDYLMLINEYGANLSDYQKAIARSLFSNLLKKGWSFEKIYWGIALLKGRPIEKYKGLFYYEDYIAEINEQVQLAQYEINKTYEGKISELSRLCGYGANSIPKEFKEAFYQLDDKIWNSGKKYTIEELKEEIDFIYEKCYLIPMFTLPLKELEYY